MAEKMAEASATYILSDGSGLLKIGSSKTPESRARSMALGRPVVLEFKTPLSAYGRVAEFLTHRRLSHARVHGEWFQVSLKEAIDTVALALKDAESGAAIGRAGNRRELLVHRHPWQIRAKQAGLTQRDLARIAGKPENTISRQLRGEFGDVPGYLIAIIIAYELLKAHGQHDDWSAAVLSELHRREDK